MQKSTKTKLLPSEKVYKCSADKNAMKLTRKSIKLSTNHIQTNPCKHLMLFIICFLWLNGPIKLVVSFGWTSWGSSNNNYLQSISDCPTFDGNRTGICVASANECRNKGGRRLGSCYSNQGGINNNLNPQYGYGGQAGYIAPFGLGVPIGVCCAIQKSCGETITQNGTYFRSPGAPSPFTDSRACQVTVARQPQICQIRLDFLKFDLDRPRTGICENDRFVVSGQASNSIIPPLCGYNTGQHMYIDLDQSNYGPITLNVITLGNRPRLFDIRVTYIHCNSPYRAPANCLQYQNGLIGQIKSFNFEESQPMAGTGYLSGLDYSICFKKPPGYCSIAYSIPRFQYSDLGQSLIHQNNQQPQNYQANPGLYFNIIGSTDKDQAGAGPYDCPSDYLQLASTPLCGSRLNGQLNPQTPNPTNNAEVVDNSTGPIVARFVSNFNEVGKGFLLDYRFNPCMVAG